MTIKDPTSQSTVTWHLLFFDKKSERLMTDVRLSDDQFMALKPYLGIVDTDDHFGSYPLDGVDIFAEEYLDGE